MKKARVSLMISIEITQSDQQGKILVKKEKLQGHVG